MTEFFNSKSGPIASEGGFDNIGNEVEFAGLPSVTNPSVREASITSTPEAAPSVPEVANLGTLDTAPDTPEAAPRAPTLDDYLRDARRNLMAMSRTAQGVVDTSASAGKADSMTGITGDAAAEAAQRNFDNAIRLAYENRGREFTMPDDLRHFVEELATEVNRGIVKDGNLIRSTDSAKYPYVRVDHLEDYAREFYAGLYGRVQHPETDPVEAAAYAEFGIDFAGHFFADGCGKTAKVVSAFMLMRAGHALPEYKGGRTTYYANQLPQIAGEDPTADAAGYAKFLAYYRGLFDDQNDQPANLTSADQAASSALAGNVLESNSIPDDLRNLPEDVQQACLEGRAKFAHATKDECSYNLFCTNQYYSDKSILNSRNEDTKEIISELGFWDEDREVVQEYGVTRQFYDAIALSNSIRAAERERGIGPTIYVLKGAPGSGKTFAARHADIPGMVVTDGEPVGTLATDNSKTDLYMAGGTSDQIHAESSYMYRYIKRQWNDYVYTQENDCSELHDRVFDDPVDVEEILDSAKASHRRVDMLDIDVPLVVSAVRVLLRPKDDPQPHPGSEYIEKVFRKTRHGRTASRKESILCNDGDPDHTGQLIKAANQNGVDINYRLLCYDYESNPKVIQREAAHLERDPVTGQTQLVITDQKLYDRATNPEETEKEIAAVSNQVIDQQFVDWYCDTFFDRNDPATEPFVAEVRGALAEYVERGFTIYQALNDKNA